MARKSMVGRRARAGENPVRAGKLALAVAVAISGTAGAGAVKAEEPAATAETRAPVVLPRIDVVAPGLTDVFETPGAVTIVTEDEIRETRPRSTEDVLRRVPGMYIKREDDSAIVTNYGVRGIPADQFKTTVLEDGVPVQPGIFVGNQRYYNPRVQRMDGVEVLRGAASLRYGPAGSGGVINYLTKTPDDGVAVTGTVGSWNTRELSVEAGGTSPSGDALFGLVVTDASSDGWMDKEWEMTDVMIKAGSAIGDDQFLGVKFSYYENDAAISYRGYFEDAFNAGATFNPAPDDRFETERKAFDINHEWDINPDMRLKTVAYWMETTRDYWRFNVDGTTTNADGHTVWNFTDILEGRNRDFERIGVDSRLFLNHALFGINNKAEFGLRYMEEEMHDTRPRATRAAPRSPIAVDGQGLRRDRLDSADSWAAFAENRFDITEQLSVTAGLRVESYEQKRKDLQEGGPADTFSNTEVVPGLGATYQLNPAVQLYGSVYQAIQPPIVGSVVGGDDTPTDAEKSLNLELGMRGATGRWNYEATAFQMDFSNQVDPGISGIRDPHEGSALIQGLEAAVGTELPAGFRVDGNLTYVPTAEFREDRFPDEGVIEKGNRLPYSPEWTANLSLGYQAGPLQSALMVNYTGAVFGEGQNQREIDPVEHRGGRIPSYYTADLTASYDINPQFSVFGAVKNVTDERYIAGLRQGIYAGPERSFELGARYEF